MTATVELRMPLGCVDIATDEMEYLDGGAYVWCRLDSNSCWEIYDAMLKCVDVARTARNISAKLGLANFTIAFLITQVVYKAGSWYVRDGARRGGIDIMRTGSTWGKGLYYTQRR